MLESMGVTVRHDLVTEQHKWNKQAYSVFTRLQGNII